MFRRVRVKNEYIDAELDLGLHNSSETGFRIISIGGLDPVQAQINTTDYASMDGGRYNSARKATRNITMKLAFDDYNFDVETIRRKAEAYFQTKTRVELTFETDKIVASTIGYVEKNEIAIFTNQEGASISIICPDPDFYVSDIMTRALKEDLKIDKAFEFPFESNDPNNPLLSFGTYEPTPDGQYFSIDLRDMEHGIPTGVVFLLRNVLADSNGDIPEELSSSEIYKIKIVQKFWKNGVFKQKETDDPAVPSKDLEYSTTISLRSFINDTTPQLVGQKDRLRPGDRLSLSTVRGSRSLIVRRSPKLNYIYKEPETTWFETLPGWENRFYIHIYDWSDDTNDYREITDRWLVSDTEHLTNRQNIIEYHQKVSSI